MIKFGDEKLKDKRSVNNLVWQAPIFDALKEDISEPDAVNVGLYSNGTTFTVMSQGTMTLGTSNLQDVLHCVVAGPGEKVSLASPYQRLGIRPGVPTDAENPDTKQMERVEIPLTFTFVDMNNAKINEKDINFLKIMHVLLQPGDCVYIPSNWWF